MLSFKHDFNDVSQIKFRFVDHKFDPLAHETRSQLYVVVHEHTVSLASADQSQHEMPLLQVLIGEIL